MPFLSFTLCQWPQQPVWAATRSSCTGELEWFPALSSHRLAGVWNEASFSGEVFGSQSGMEWPTSVSLAITFTLHFWLKSHAQTDVLPQYCNCPSETCQLWLILASLLVPLEPFTPPGWSAGMGIDRASGQTSPGHPCPLDQPITEGCFSICNAIMSISRHSGFLSNTISSNQEKCPNSYSSKLFPFPLKYSINLLSNPLTGLLIATN